MSTSTFKKMKKYYLKAFSLLILGSITLTLETNALLAQSSTDTSTNQQGKCAWQMQESQQDDAQTVYRINQNTNSSIVVNPRSQDWQGSNLGGGQQGTVTIRFGGTNNNNNNNQQEDCQDSWQTDTNNN